MKLADTLTADYDVLDLLNTLVQECVELLNVQAGGLLLADGIGNLQLVASTSEEANVVEVHQLAAGVGPCLDCFDSGRAVSVGDILQTGSRWPAFRSAMREQGFQSVHATPMRLRGEMIGAMALFDSRTGELSEADATVAQALADVASVGILQQRNLRDASLVAEQVQRALQSRILIEQAKGVLSETRGVTMDQAFTAIRLHAHKNDLSLRSVAEKIIDRTLDPSKVVAANVSAKSGTRG